MGRYVSKSIFQKDFASYQKKVQVLAKQFLTVSPKESFNLASFLRLEILKEVRRLQVIKNKLFSLDSGNSLLSYFDHQIPQSKTE